MASRHAPEQLVETSSCSSVVCSHRTASIRSRSTRAYARPFITSPRASSILGADHDLDTRADLAIGCCCSVCHKRYAQLLSQPGNGIDWNPSSFDHLTMPAEKKKVIRALSKAHLNQNPNRGFDDVIRGKARGLVSLLQGPPGVGKTLTAEALSEDLQRPLYMVSAGEIGTKSEDAEKTLTQIFDIASHWKAVLLLDEADVFVEQRTMTDVARNALVCVFLRKIEYLDGILFLTTNRVKTIDEAIASRIHLPLRYDGLDQSARKEVWKSFLTTANTTKRAAPLPSKYFERLAKKELNGREIKNALSVAQALADDEKSRMGLSHLEEAIDFNEQFQLDFRGAGQVENMNSYL